MTEQNQTQNDSMETNQNQTENQDQDQEQKISLEDIVNENRYLKSKLEKLSTEQGDLISQRDKFQRELKNQQGKPRAEDLIKSLEEDRDNLKTQLSNLMASQELSRKREIFTKVAKSENLQQQFLDNLDILNVDFSRIDLDDETQVSAKVLVKELQNKLPNIFTSTKAPPSPDRLNNEKTKEQELDELYNSGNLVEWAKKMAESKS